MNNLSKRIITSTILLLIISISLFYDKNLWLFFLIIVSLIIFIEFNNLTKKIWKNKKKNNHKYKSYFLNIFGNNYFY